MLVQPATPHSRPTPGLKAMQKTSATAPSGVHATPSLEGFPPWHGISTPTRDAGITVSCATRLCPVSISCMTIYGTATKSARRFWTNTRTMSWAVRIRLRGRLSPLRPRRRFWLQSPLRPAGSGLLGLLPGRSMECLGIIL